MRPTIDAVSVAAIQNGTMRGDDAWFIALHGAGKIGWYGPVSTEIARYVETVLASAVTGVLTTDHHRLHAAVRCATGAGATAVASWAVGAVDCAAWDLHGQLVRAPVAHLLAPSSETTVPLYASWLSLNVSRPTPVATVEHVGRGGWQFTKWGLRRESNDDPGVEAARLGATVGAVAAALGEAAAFDAVFTWNATLAELVADRLDPANLLWLEDPLPDYNLEGYRPLATKVPLAVGERLFVHADGQALLGLQPRAFTLDVVACGGLTRAIDLVTAAHARGILVYPHGRSFVPGLHLAAAFPHAVPAVEYRLQWEPVRQRGYARPWLPAQGQISIPRSPGLGATPRSG